MTPVEEVKSKLDIVDVVNEYVHLKPAGANFKARCPFHDERTPSFMVSRSKQIWHCFGCQEGGDVVSFVMKSEGLEFPDALKLLADKAGVRLRTENTVERSQRQRLATALEAAVHFWEQTLWEQPAAREARRYLQDERHILPETVREWRLGFAPDSWEALLDYLSSQGVTTEEAIGAGVAIRKMEVRGRSAYDRFRNRITFPIANAHGQVVGVSARTLASNPTEAKYINTPETMLYRKSAVLYGLDKAKGEIRKQNIAVVVEGNLDVVSSHQAGVANVVAASGTALTREQAELLKRYTSNVAFCFDADPAGESATLRGLVTALSLGLNVSLITLPFRPDGTAYKDPDECVRVNPELWRQAIGRAAPMMEHYFERAVAGRSMQSLQDKQDATKLLLPLIARIPDKVAAMHYLQKLSSLVQVPEQYLREAMLKVADSASPALRTAEPAKQLPDSRTMQSERLLAGLISAPQHAEYVMGAVAPEMLAEKIVLLYREMVVFYTKRAEREHGGRVDWRDPDFAQHLQSQPDGATLAERFEVLNLLADKEFTEVEAADFERELIVMVTRLKRMYLRTALRELEQQLRLLEQSPEPDAQRLQNLMQEFQSVSAELVNLDTRESAL